MGRPLFTVIVPTFRRPQMLAEALASIQGQTELDFECIVVDDASGEEVHIPDDPRFRLIRRTSGGSQAGAINTGIENAKGEYVAFLDDDDLFDSHRLAITRDGFEHADIVVVWGRVMGEKQKPGRTLQGNVHHTILDATTPQLGTVTVRREVLLPFDSTYPASADVEWWLRMSEKATVTTVPVSAHQFRVHQGVRVRNSKGNRVKASLRLMGERSEYFARHPRALAFRCRRAAAAASRSGDHGLARRLLVRSLRTHFDLRVVKQLLRTRHRSTQQLEVDLGALPNPA